MTHDAVAVRPRRLGALDTPLLVVALAADADACRRARAPLDARDRRRARRALERRDFRGGRDETLHLAGGADAASQRVLLVGHGHGRRIGRRALRRAGGDRRRAQANKLGVGELAFYAGALDATRSRGRRRSD